jgi:hypothetical protein
MLEDCMQVSPQTLVGYTQPQLPGDNTSLQAAGPSRTSLGSGCLVSHEFPMYHVKPPSPSSLRVSSSRHLSSSTSVFEKEVLTILQKLLYGFR